MKKILFAIAICLISSNAYTCTCAPTSINCFTLYSDGLKDLREAFENNRCESGYIYEVVTSTKPVETTIIASKIEAIKVWEDEMLGDYSGSIQKSDKNGVKTTLNMAIMKDRLTSTKSYNTLTAYSNALGFSKTNIEFISILVDYIKQPDGDLLGCNLSGKDVRDFVNIDFFDRYNPSVEFNSKELICY